MNTRVIAYEWWRSLTGKQQNSLVQQFYPDKKPIFITTSGQKIEEMYWEINSIHKEENAI
jgi:hypothetical protein